MKPIDQLSDTELEQLARRAAALPDAPPGLVNAAIGLFRSSAPSPAASVAGAAIRRIIAALRFDSWAVSPLAAGVRAGASDVRHFLFSASGRDVDLRVAPDADRYTLSGQILGPDEAGSVELAAAEQRADTPPSRTVELDPLGEFRIDDVPRGSYEITLRVAGHEIVLPTIEVGERRP